MKYRVIKASHDEDSISNWIIQKKSFWTGKWLFHSGYYVSKEQAEQCIEDRVFFESPQSLPASVWLSHNYGISIDDLIIDNGKYKNQNYFKKGPLKVVRVEYGRFYFGAAILYAFHEGVEVGFCLDGIKRAGPRKVTITKDIQGERL